PEDLDRVRAAYASAGIAAELAPFFTHVADRLGAAHVVIARAGASTVAELAVAARPAVLVPLPGATDDHPSANAASLAAGGVAIVMPQTTLTPVALAEAIERMLLSSPHPVSQPADAAQRLADLVERVVQEPTR